MDDERYENENDEDALDLTEFDDSVTDDSVCTFLD